MPPRGSEALESARSPRVAYLMVVLDVSIVNVALPSIQTDLNFSPENLQWVVSGYALTFGGFPPGRARRRPARAALALHDRPGRLRALRSPAASPPRRDAHRVPGPPGMAGAILSPSVFSIVSVTFREGSERNKALGILGAIAGSGAAIGVLSAGILTEYAGWEWIFYVNVPIGLAALALVPRYVPESHAEGMTRHFDTAGAVTVTASLMLLVA